LYKIKNLLRMRFNPLSKKYCFMAIKTTESIQYDFIGIFPR